MKIYSLSRYSYSSIKKNKIEINLAKEEKDLCTENYKMLLKDILKGINNERHPMLIDWETYYR